MIVQTFARVSQPNPYESVPFGDGDRLEALRLAVMDRAARAGMPVYQTGGGGFAVGLAGCRELPDVRSLQRFLSQMGAAA